MAHLVQPKFRYCKGHGGEGGAEANAEAAGRGSASEPPPNTNAEHDLFGRLVQNPAAEVRWAEAFGHPVLVPPRASFLMSDATRLDVLARRRPHAFRCIVIDPPWENKSVARLNALGAGGTGAGKASGTGSTTGGMPLYPTLPSYHLLRLPVGQLASRAGCLVALWVTHREKLRRFVEERLLPAWGLRRVATWHWLKVTNGGEPVGPLSGAHRRPYESLLLCCQADGAAPWEESSGAGCSPPDGLVLVATPAQHSRKPPLEPLLRRHLPDGADCLEMFARSLACGVTSWGNECLKFQGREHFVPGIEAP